jgi:hypothetical protein
VLAHDRYPTRNLFFSGGSEMWGAPLYISRDPTQSTTKTLLVLHLVHQPLTPFECRHGSALKGTQAHNGQPPTPFACGRMVLYIPTLNNPQSVYSTVHYKQ